MSHPFSLKARAQGPVAAIVGWLVAALSSAGAAPLLAAQVEFFEKKIRPVLVAECYECHGAEKTKGGLRLDYRDGWKKGGDTGDAIVPGAPEKSLLMESIRHLDPDLKMPDKAPKLEDAVIADFEQWIAMGAPDPRDEPPAAHAGKPTWTQLLAVRKSWWSLQPVQKPALPVVQDAGWSGHPVDRFLLAKMEAKGLAPAAAADPRTFIRRLTFALTGLPPTSEEVEAFVAASISNQPSAIGDAISRLLAAPRFGEHWARHWMDLMRYAETHGSEGDPEIPQAWRYRDYLIRAFNAGVPGDRLIREHLAGDLLPQPRMNPDGFNESILGTAQFRFVEHGFQPVDTLDDQVNAVDNQIEGVTKAFQATTVSCARCHDHKFDAVSQRDFTALYGIFASCRPAQITIDSAEVQNRNRAELETLHGKIKAGLAEAWLASAAEIGARQRTTAATAPAQAWADVLRDAATNEANPFHPWVKLTAEPTADFPAAWRALATQAAAKLEDARSFNRENFRLMWDLTGGEYAKWFPYGSGLPAQPAKAGEFSITPSGDRILDGLLPAGVFTHRLSDRHNGLLTSPSFKIDSDCINVRAAGGGGSSVRVIVDHYPLPSNPIFPKALLEKEEPGWVRIDTAYRKGSMAYLEFGTRDDVTRPLPEKKGSPKSPRSGEGRSFFAVERIVTGDGKELPREENLALVPLLEGPAPESSADLAAHYTRVFTTAVAAWRDGRVTEPQRALLDSLVRRGVLPTTLRELEKVRPLVAEYRRLEGEVPKLQRAPGVLESVATDAPLFERGEHTKPGALVPRGYLGVLGGQPYRTTLSGRLELAEEIASAQNPLTARVMVNRIWHWLFGQGLVPTVDNFGRLGERPTHPELLDFLAAEFVERGWSTKELIRTLVSTRAFAMSSTPSAHATATDPANAWLSHARVRRIDAESVRDSLLAVSGQLDPKMSGQSADADAPRRSLYLRVKRTVLNPFLQVFDAPKPFTTLGRRDLTNVPAQSLTMLNSPFVIEQAKQWAEALVKDDCATVEARVGRMFTTAFARPPSDHELAAAKNFLATLAAERREKTDMLLTSAPVWQDFAQALFNLKEFIYVR